MPYIGIDFGTSNSVVANFQFGQAEVVPNHEGQKWTPSIVTMRRDGSLASGGGTRENRGGAGSLRSHRGIRAPRGGGPLGGKNRGTEQSAVFLFGRQKRAPEPPGGEGFVRGVAPSPANSK